jgi:hypothetical protein
VNRKHTDFATREAFRFKTCDNYHLFTTVVIEKLSFNWSRKVMTFTELACVLYWLDRKKYEDLPELRAKTGEKTCMLNSS